MLSRIYSDRNRTLPDLPATSFVLFIFIAEMHLGKHPRQLQWRIHLGTFGYQIPAPPPPLRQPPRITTFSDTARPPTLSRKEERVTSNKRRIAVDQGGYYFLYAIFHDVTIGTADVENLVSCNCVRYR